MASSKVSRRDLLKLSAGTLLALGLWPGFKASAAEQTQNFSFAVLNDLHCMTSDCWSWFLNVASDVKSRKPSFCVLAGDLTDNADIKYMKAVGSIFKILDCPLHVQIGNHDYLSNSDRSSFVEVFPSSINYSFEYGGFQCLGLDTTQGQLYTRTEIQKDTFRWVENALPKLSKKAPLIIFTHFPLGAKAPNRPLNADTFLDRFLDYNLHAVFCGHHHGFTLATRGATTLTTNKCCSLKKQNHDGTTEKGYFMCDVKDGVISRRFIQINGEKAERPLRL